MWPCRRLNLCSACSSGQRGVRRPGPDDPEHGGAGGAVGGGAARGLEPLRLLSKVLNRRLRRLAAGLPLRRLAGYTRHLAGYSRL